MSHHEGHVLYWKVDPGAGGQHRLIPVTCEAHLVELTTMLARMISAYEWGGGTDSELLERAKKALVAPDQRRDTRPLDLPMFDRHPI